MQNTFEERYRSGDLPWDHGIVDSNLVETIKESQINPCNALDIGCGTGDNAIWMATQGFNVTACDLSETAVRIAGEKAEKQGIECIFQVADFLTTPIPGGPFGLVFDRGCFHCMDDVDAKKAYACKVNELLDSGGMWVTLVGNADEKERDEGPPQMSATMLVSIVEPYFEVISLTSSYFGSDQEMPPRAWICLLQKRS